MESAGVHERQQRHSARRQTETRVLPVMGQLLREIHSRLRGRGNSDLGTFDPERTDGYAEMGVVYLFGRGRKRLPQEPSWTNAKTNGSGQQENHRLGSQSRSDLLASQHAARR